MSKKPPHVSGAFCCAPMLPSLYWDIQFGGTMNIKITNEIPAIYERLREKFGVDWDSGVIIACFPLVHCKVALSADKIVHESVHLLEQEKMGVEIWWDLFLSDQGFRLEQEVMAYRREAAFIRKNIKDRNVVAKFVHSMAATLSSPMYGSICSYQEAMIMLN